MKTLVRSIWRSTLKPFVWFVSSTLRKLRGNKAIFTEIYHRNQWNSEESVSGKGSEIQETMVIRERLPEIIKNYGVESLLDAPCGDFNWMKEITQNLDYYLGVDIVSELTEKNNRQYGTEKRQFATKDVTVDPLPQVDLILCRDCLVHLPNELAVQALKNFQKSGSKYLLTTTFTARSQNDNIVIGNWRPINLQVAPFNLPPPLELINEECSEGEGAFKDKCIALWRLDDISLK